jgi:hypothetical protein
MTPLLAIALDPPPVQVSELADACIRYVQAALGMRLDFAPETLPVLDHYIAGRRAELEKEPLAASLIARVVAAYFGEVVRRRIASFWHAPSDDPSVWQLRFEPVYLSFSPYEIAYDAITLGDQGEPTAQLSLDEEDRDAVEARLAELPAATDEEFFSLTTRLEVLDITVDAIKARMMSTGLGQVAFSPEDYDRE